MEYMQPSAGHFRESGNLHLPLKAGIFIRRAATARKPPPNIGRKEK